MIKLNDNTARLAITPSKPPCHLGRTMPLAIAPSKPALRVKMHQQSSNLTCHVTCVIELSKSGKRIVELGMSSKTRFAQADGGVKCHVEVTWIWCHVVLFGSLNSIFCVTQVPEPAILVSELVILYHLNPPNFQQCALMQHTMSAFSLSKLSFGCLTKFEGMFCSEFGALNNTTYQLQRVLMHFALALTYPHARILYIQP